MPVDRPELAARGQQIIITATAATEPVLRGEWIEDGTHLNVIGSNFLSKAGDRRRCRPAGQPRRRGQQGTGQAGSRRLGAGDRSRRAALDATWSIWARCWSARLPGRGGPKDVTLFKSVGLAIEDVVTAARVYEAAKEQGIGRQSTGRCGELRIKRVRAAARPAQPAPRLASSRPGLPPAAGRGAA